MGFGPGCFCCLRFGGVSLGRNFETSRKMRDESVLAKFAIDRLYGHFGSRGFGGKCCPMFALQVHTNYEMIGFASGYFCGLIFGGVSLGRNFAKSQKMRDEGVLAKFAIARLYGHFESRGLQQNLVLCLHFKCILIKRWWHLRQGVFVAFFLEGFALVAILQNFRKCAMRVSLPNLP